jgi:DNA-binding FadR family transcriptional regulator
VSGSISTVRGAGSLVQQAMRAVTGHIRAKALKVGDALPAEGHFASELGVSRAVMREAFGALAALNLIDVGNGRRARVAALDSSPLAASMTQAVNTDQVSVPQVWDVRRTLEVRTAELAAANRTLAEAAQITDLADAMALAGDDLPQRAAHDIAFHLAIAQATHNELFSQIVASFAPLMTVAIPTAWRTRETESQRLAVLENHRNVARAISDADPAAARQAMETHFDESVGHLLASLEG